MEIEVSIPKLAIFSTYILQLIKFLFFSPPHIFYNSLKESIQGRRGKVIISLIITPVSKSLDKLIEWFIENLLR